MPVIKYIRQFFSRKKIVAAVYRTNILSVIYSDDTENKFKGSACNWSECSTGRKVKGRESRELDEVYVEIIDKKMPYTNGV